MDLRKLKDKAAEAMNEGKLKDALKFYQEIIGHDAKDLQSKTRLGDVHRKLGNVEDAVIAYREVAQRYAEDGFLLKAIAVCKVILEVDPRHTDTQQMLAGLYSKKVGGRAPKAGGRPLAKVPLGKAATQPGGASALRAPASPTATTERGGTAASVASAAEAWMGEPQREGSLNIMDPIELESVHEVIQPDPASDGWLSEPSDVSGILAAHQESTEERQQAAGVVSASVAELATASEAGAFEIPLPEGESGAPAAKVAPVSTAYRDWVQAPAPSAMPAPSAPAAPSPPRPAVAPVSVAPVAHALPVPSAAAPAPDEAPAPAGKALPEIPLFSDLSKNAFIEVLVHMKMREMKLGEVVIREGELGNSFFIVAQGKVRVSKKSERGEEMPLAELTDGGFFGEMALLGDTPRTASVTVVEPSQIFELGRAMLERVGTQYPSVQKTLDRIYRQRLLSTLIATNPIFRPFPPQERKALIEQFKSREVDPGMDLLVEGEKPQGLFLLLAGSCEVAKEHEGKMIPVAHLRPGDVFGEMSLLSHQAAIATVVARKRSIVLRLPKKTSEELIMTHPAVLEHLSMLADERRRLYDAILDGRETFVPQVVGESGAAA